METLDGQAPWLPIKVTRCHCDQVNLPASLTFDIEFKDLSMAFQAQFPKIHTVMKRDLRVKTPQLVS